MSARLLDLYGSLLPGAARRRDYNRDLPCGAARDAGTGVERSPMCGITGFLSHRPAPARRCRR